MKKLQRLVTEAIAPWSCTKIKPILCLPKKTLLHFKSKHRAPVAKLKPKPITSFRAKYAGNISPC